MTGNKKKINKQTKKLKRPCKWISNQTFVQILNLFYTYVCRILVHKITIQKYLNRKP